MITGSGVPRRLLLTAVLVLAGTLLVPAPAHADWSRPVVLSRGDWAHNDPLVDVDAQGDAMVAWQRNNKSFEPESHRILLTKRTRAGRWSETRIVTPRGTDAYLEGMAVDADGDAVVAWNADSILYARRVRRDLSMGRIKQISVTGTLGINTAVAVDDAGNALFTWNASTGAAQRQPHARRWTAGGRLGPEVYLPDTPGVAADAAPQPALTPDGRGIVSWGDDQSAYARRYAPAAGWGPVTPLGTTRDGSHLDSMRPFVDDAGNATVLWVTAGHADQEFLYAVRLPADGPPGEPWRISERSDVSQWTGAMDAEGDLRVIWNSGLDVPAFTRHVPASGAMGQEQRLTRRSTYLELVMRRGGSGLLGWGLSAWDVSSRARSVRFRADGTLGGTVFPTTYAPSGGFAPVQSGRYLHVHLDPRNDETAKIQARIGP